MAFRHLYVVFALLMLFSGINSSAQTHRAFQNRTVQSYSTDSSRRNYISGALGFLSPGANTLVGSVNGAQQTTSFKTSGLFAIGGDYEYMLMKDFSVGGVVRYYNASSTINTVNVQDSLFTLGPVARAYLSSEGFIPYISAGLMFMAPSVVEGNNTYSISSGIGLMMSLGVLYQINNVVAVGIETMRLTGLSNSINGSPVEDYMLKGRFALGQ